MQKESLRSSLTKTLLVGREKPWRLTIVICGFLTVAIAGVLLHILTEGSTSDAANQQLADNQKFSSLEGQSNVDTASGKFTQAATAWKEYASETPSLTHKKLALEQVGAMDMSSADYTQAAQEYAAATKVGGITYSEAAALAQAYIRLGQNNNAVQYLQQALRLMPSNLDAANAQRALDNQEIQSLGGQ